MNIEPLEPRTLLSSFYVATSGSNSASGSANAPWRTLAHAAGRVQPGDSVTVRPGGYVGFQTGRDGTSGGRITFKAESGARITSPGNSGGDGINLEGANYWTIDGFTINNMPRAGIRSVTNTGVVIVNNTTDANTRWGIFTGFSQGVRIENNTASRSAQQHGIYVSNSADNPIIRGNVAWGNNAAGIQINADKSQGGDGLITGALIDSNVLYDNGRGRGGATINLDGVQSSRIVNNLLYDNNNHNAIALFKGDGAAGSKNNTVVNNTILVTRGAAVHVQGGSTGNRVTNNILLASGSGRSYDVSSSSKAGFVTDYNVVKSRYFGQDAHSFSATTTELFVNAPADDYHLSASSPAINRGTSANAPAVDFEGTVRTGGIDIGADER